MDQQERREFVRSHRTCVFGYNRRDDGPAMTVVYYMMNGDDELLISTMAARSKARMVGGGRKVSVCVLDENWPFTYVQVYGDAVVDRDPELVERYREDPRGTVEWWEAERANVILNVLTGEKSSWLTFDDTEREALATHDYPKLFELGAHPFLTLTLFIALFERDHTEPLGFQLEYAQRLSHFTMPYPDITT